MTKHLSQRQEALAILESHNWVLLEALAPGTRAVDGGRRPAQPFWFGWYFTALVDLTGSASMAEALLADPVTWEQIVDWSRQHLPVHLHLRLEPPFDRYQFGRWQGRVTRSGLLNAVTGVLEDEAVRIAKAIGLFAPTGGSWTHPDPLRTIHSDGVVLSPPSTFAPGQKVVEVTTGEILVDASGADLVRRSVAGVQVHRTGSKRGKSGASVVGHKFTVLAAHRPVSSDPAKPRRERVILSIVASSPEPGHNGQHRGEAGDMIDALRRVVPKLEHAQALAVDAVARGTHIRTVQQEIGLLVVAPVAAQVKETSTTARIEKEAYLGRSQRGGAPGSADIDLYAFGGRLCGRVVLVDGTVEYMPLTLRQVRRRRDVGSYRWYGAYDIPEPLGGGSLNVPFLSNEQDRANGLNREEVLRVIPPGTDDYDRLHGHRQSSESINCTAQYNLPRGRARTYSLERQLIEMIGHQIRTNARALHYYNARLQRAAAA